MSKSLISFEEFLEIEKRLEIKMGTVVGLERINKKMLKLDVDLGEHMPRTVITNIGNRLNLPWDANEQDLIGCQFPFITNLAPANISGYESAAMIMAAEFNGELHNMDLAKKVYRSGSKLL